MLINLREKTSKKLVIKDYLDLDFDMVVEETPKVELFFSLCLTPANGS